MRPSVVGSEERSDCKSQCEMCSMPQYCKRTNAQKRGDKHRFLRRKDEAVMCSYER